MINLQFKCVENSKNTSGEGGNHPAGGSGQLSRDLIRELTGIAKEMGCNYFAHHLPMDTDAEMKATYSEYVANYNLFTLEEYTQEWIDAIHDSGMNVLHRGTWSGIKGNNDFDFVTFGTGGFIPLGTVEGAATEGETTYCGKLWRWMDVNVGASRWRDGDIVAPISECTEYLSNSNYRWFDNSVSDQAGLYTFFTTLHEVVDAYAATIGKSLRFGTIVNYSEYKSGYLNNTLPNDTGFIMIDYYGHAGGYSSGSHVEPSHYVTDWTSVNTQVNSSVGKLFQTEMGGIFGDSWPTLGATPAAHSRRITTYEESAKYQIDFYKAYRDSLVDEDIMIGMNNWGFWSGQNSSIVDFEDGHYRLNYMGQIYASFIKGNGMSRVPVPVSGDYNSDAWGGRNIYF